MKIARLINIIEQNEPDYDLFASDDIDFDKVSDHTLSLLHEFIFPTTRSLSIEKIHEKKSLIEVTWLPDGQLRIQLPHKDDEPKISYVLSMDALKNMFLAGALNQHTLGAVNMIEMNALMNMYLAGASNQHTVAAVNMIEMNGQNNTDPVESLTSLFSRDWFSETHNETKDDVIVVQEIAEHDTDFAEDEDSSDSSWGEPMSPDEFHSRLADLMFLN